MIHSIGPLYVTVGVSYYSIYSNGLSGGNEDRKLEGS